MREKIRKFKSIYSEYLLDQMEPSSFIYSGGTEVSKLLMPLTAKMIGQVESSLQEKEYRKANFWAEIRSQKR